MNKYLLSLVLVLLFTLSGCSFDVAGKYDAVLNTAEPNYFSSSRYTYLQGSSCNSHSDCFDGIAASIDHCTDGTCRNIKTIQKTNFELPVLGQRTQNYDDMGSLEEIAQMISAFDYFILGQVMEKNHTWENGDFVTSKFENIEELVIRIKEINPHIKLYGYAPATVDNPTKERFIQLYNEDANNLNICRLIGNSNNEIKLSGPYSYLPSPRASWSYEKKYVCDCPNGICIDFVNIVNKWHSIKDSKGNSLMDGIFVDLPFPTYITPAHRDNIFSAIKNREMSIMANAGHHSNENINFIVDSEYMMHDDLVFMDSYYLKNGVASESSAQKTVNSLLNLPKGIGWVALAKEDGSKNSINCANQRKSSAYNHAVKNGASAFGFILNDQYLRTHTFYCPQTWLNNSQAKKGSYKECLLDSDCFDGDKNTKDFCINYLCNDNNEYISDETICSSFKYSDWSSCSYEGIRTRRVISSYPSKCSGGNPVVSESCQYDSDVGDQLFIYQGNYGALEDFLGGGVDEVASLIAKHDIAVMTHGFKLNEGVWTNGKCVDAAYSKMPELLKLIREKNPNIKIFAYVSATADNPNACWPINYPRQNQCPNGICSDFIKWVNLWLNLEKNSQGVIIDGFFIDLVFTTDISEGIRDNVFSYVKSRDKLILANVGASLENTKFASSSSYFTNEDYVIIEGYYIAAGNPNSASLSAANYAKENSIQWLALANEPLGTSVNCNSQNMRNGYSTFLSQNGVAFAYQGADLGTISKNWIYCDNSN